ncbi:MAG: hypothetical protein HY286_02010 [Planctomycetes bacterium]|nr:hypothetical protein [Planctomycetota bacterium]
MKKKAAKKANQVRRKPGPEPERLHIPPNKIIETLERLVGKKPESQQLRATGSMDVTNPPKPKS